MKALRDILDALLLAVMLAFGGLAAGAARFGTRLDAALFEEDGLCCR